MPSDILKKPLSECTNTELDILQMNTFQERKHRTFKELERVVELYLELHGHEHGLNELGEDLCKDIANRVRPDGWGSLVRHLVKISG